MSPPQKKNHTRLSWMYCRGGVLQAFRYGYFPYKFTHDKAAAWSHIGGPLWIALPCNGLWPGRIWDLLGNP